MTWYETLIVSFMRSVTIAMTIEDVQTVSNLDYYLLRFLLIYLNFPLGIAKK